MHVWASACKSCSALMISREYSVNPFSSKVDVGFQSKEESKVMTNLSLVFFIILLSSFQIVFSLTFSHRFWTLI